MTLTKAELMENLARQVGLAKPDAKALVDLFFETIKTALENGEEVKLSGFGRFMPRDKPPRPGRNPKTMEDKVIAARRVVTFKSGPTLKAQVEKLPPLVTPP